MTHERAIEKAIKRHVNIFLCGECKSFEESFLMDCFWYNDQNGSTHVVVLHPFRKLIKLIILRTKRIFHI